ncbi:unnamed protein product [Malus baccata var. baccata]
MEVECHVVVHNIAKRHNVGTLARAHRLRQLNAFGNHGSTTHLLFCHFHSLQDAQLYLKERDCDICGVEITDNALPVKHHTFTKSTAFLLGNEIIIIFYIWRIGNMRLLVYIPQYGGGTASLNVTVGASIVLHQFGVWAGFPGRTREGNKFIVAEKPEKQTRRSFCAETADSVIEQRKCRKEFAANGFFDESGNENSSYNLLYGLFADVRI